MNAQIVSCSLSDFICDTLQQTATHCNTLHHTVTHDKPLQHTPGGLEEPTQKLPPQTLSHTATHYKHCKKLQYIATHTWCFGGGAQKEASSSDTASHYKRLQHTVTHYKRLQHTPGGPGVPKKKPPPQTLQHTAKHCNTLQHTATHCNTHLVVRGNQKRSLLLRHCNT